MPTPRTRRRLASPACHLASFAVGPTIAVFSTPLRTASHVGLCPPHRASRPRPPFGARPAAPRLSILRAAAAAGGPGPSSRVGRSEGATRRPARAVTQGARWAWGRVMACSRRLCCESSMLAAVRTQQSERMLCEDVLRRAPTRPLHVHRAKLYSFRPVLFLPGCSMHSTPGKRHSADNVNLVDKVTALPRAHASSLAVVTLCYDVASSRWSGHLKPVTILARCTTQSL